MLNVVKMEMHSGADRNTFGNLALDFCRAAKAVSGVNSANYFWVNPNLIGFIIDFQEIEDSFNPIRKLLDHAYLNDIKGLENPTSENMCKYIWAEIKPKISGLVEIEIKETYSTGCIYRGD